MSVTSDMWQVTIGQGRSRAGNLSRVTRPLSPASAFTLIEIMIVVGLIAIVMAVAIPAFVAAHNKTPMRKALNDVMEACATARAQAILHGSLVELRIRPQDYTFDVSATGKSETSVGAADARPSAQAGDGHNVFSVKLPSEVGIEELAINFQLLKDAEYVAVRFHANGTCDEFTVILRSLYGDVRKITLDPVTGRADYDVIR